MTTRVTRRLSPRRGNRAGWAAATRKGCDDDAIEKLRAAGPALPFPHQSGVQGVEKLRELRSRGGRSPWRGFYRWIGDVFVIAAVGPEAETDHRGFDRATAAAVTRLDDVHAEGDTP